LKILQKSEGLFRSLGQGADSAGRKAQLHAAKTLGLDIDLEFATGSNIRVTARVPSLGTTTSHLTDSAHKRIYLG
jgi:hypothetical protein